MNKALSEFAAAEHTVTGQKQVLQELENGTAETVFLAEDADGQIKRLIVGAAKETDAEIVPVDTMAELGAAAGIRVAATCAAIVKGK